MTVGPESMNHGLLASAQAGVRKRRRPPNSALNNVRQFGLNDPATAAEKAGRNDPCPCGSQKKFKRCCL